MKSMVIHKIPRRGFTLVETLVAITILLLVIIGPMTVAQKGVKNAYFASEQLTAVFLAQEEIEAVREFRDKQALDVYDVMSSNGTTNNSADWVPAACGGQGGLPQDCFYNAEDGSFLVTSGGGYSLNYDTVAKRYVKNASGNTVTTPYKRKTTFTPVGGNAWNITTSVTWNAQAFGNTPREVKLQTWLYDQYQRYEN